MKIIIGAIVFGLIVISIIVMLVINFTYKGLKKVKEEVVDDYYQHQKEKELKEKHPFDKDYFKSASTKKNQHSNVTIIDDRETSDKRKIFDDQDGEYVEFEEVSD